MLPIVLSILLVIAMGISIAVLIQRRKKAGITGVKTALSSICLYLMAVVNLCAYWLDFMGIISWTLSIVLLFLAAYFTKFLHFSKDR
ncbi:hypothetical protein [Radiobacillus deserti]|uniref:Uncharacterized protein n=1 Tax=Radiobacillus deserti TaxID=2594883 RepID=A0A516KDC7_9BACI|nr:hypothetical protein [Radiobacillus deserti]QDP39414.1 hypothetical protein FN924_03940 [Radiobacillus deserti]